MDINFTPEAVLGGYIYHFNCTAYEIDECNQTNIDFYKIQSIGTYSETLQYVKDYFGQSQQVFPANEDVIGLLQNEYQKYVEDGYSAYYMNDDVTDEVKILGKVNTKPKANITWITIIIFILFMIYYLVPTIM